MAAEPCCVIVPFDSPMLPDEYGQMLREQGRKSPALVLPETPSTPEQIARWADSCRRYHEWLLSRVPVDGLTTDVHGDLIRRAHRAAWAGDPMPDE